MDENIPSSHIDLIYQAALTNQKEKQVIHKMRQEVDHYNKKMLNYNKNFDEFLNQANLAPGLYPTN